VFGKISTGAANDIQRATDIVRRMITDYGMSSKFENVALSKRGGYGGFSAEPQLIREYAEATQQYIDDQIASNIKTQYELVINMLSGKRQLLDYIAARLLEKETIDEAEFREIVEAESTLGQRAAASEAVV
jgi:cell division protease FtsH